MRRRAGRRGKGVKGWDKGMMAKGVMVRTVVVMAEKWETQPGEREWVRVWVSVWVRAWEWEWEWEWE